MSKKVLLVIVEGRTEETILYDYLVERFKKLNVYFDIQRGDILSDWESKRVNRNIKNAIGNKIRGYLEKRKFLPTDLIAVLHITDSDGCFIPNEQVVIKSSQKEEKIYTDDRIIVRNAEKKKDIENRNAYKSSNIKELIYYNSFNLKGTKVSYQLFYFSTNIDHVLWDERNEIKDAKLDKAERFIESLDGSIEDFLFNFFEIGVASTYIEKVKYSWEYIMQHVNSLKRVSNVPLLFELIASLEESRN